MAARFAICMAAAVCATAVSACAGPEIEPPMQSMGLSCVDDSPHCINERKKSLNVMMADKSRAWVRQPATASSYASGVRLWAFKEKKRELSCDELALARREADGATGSLRGAKAALTPAQISRGIMLAQDISKELGREFGRRCRA